MEELPPEVLKDIEKQVDDVFENSLQGRYVLGAMYMAMKEGRPLIVDEANAISPDVLIAFNDLLTKKIGDTVQTRGVEGEFAIKKGYCIIWTGNTGKRYENQAGRKDLDPAAYSRIVPIKVEYLPQSREINSLNDPKILGRLELNKLQEKALGFSGNDEIIEYAKEIREGASNDQIFQVLVLKLMNDRMGTELLTKSDDRYSVFKDLYRLSMGARLIMDLFEDKVGDSLAQAGVGNLKQLINVSTYQEVISKLKRANLSMRELIDNIVGSYQDQGGSMDIEFYLFKFVKKYDQYPEEQAIILTMLRKCGFFDPVEGWPDYQNATDLSLMKKMLAENPVEIETLSKYKTVRINGDYVSMVNTDGKYSKEYFTSLEMMQMLFGYLPPMKKETYEKVGGVIESQRGVEKGQELNKKLLGNVVELTELLREYKFDKRSDLRELSDQLRPVAARVMDKKFFQTATDEQLSEGVGEFCDIIISFLGAKGKINAEDYTSAMGMSTDSKVGFLKNVLGKGK